MSVGSRITALARRARPDRVVHREVQGVALTLPWSHKLPDYAARFPQYGQNLVAVAEAVAAVRGEPFVMVDVGANVGDSALQVLAKVDARVLCVEGDGYWLRYLHRNVDDEPRVQVLPALVMPDSGAGSVDEPVVAVRRSGTTQFHKGGDGHDVAPGLSADEVREQSHDLGPVALVKSDTDGYDTRIVPAMARAWSDSHPVLFFEFDPGMTRAVGDDDPQQVWPALAELGYDTVAVWDNFGDPRGVLRIDSIAEESAAVLDRPLDERDHHYWDVAAIHRDDVALREAIVALLGGRTFADRARKA